jgi:hypothetical protein
MPVHGGRSGDDVRAGAIERGGPRRGGVEPSSVADLAEGASAVPPWRAVGATRIMIVSCVCFRFVG